MGKTIRLFISGDRGVETRDMDLDAARRAVEEAKAQGRFVIDRKRGEQIQDLHADVEEILIIDIVEGG